MAFASREFAMSEERPKEPLPILPPVRCLTKEQAAAYLGIGVTLLIELGVPMVKLGRRSVYDRIDLDAWLDEYKRRGRAGKEGEPKWPVKEDSIGGGIPATGGSTLYYRTADAYARALGLKTGKKPKPSSPS
jgi:hypothetical protein